MPASEPGWRLPQPARIDFHALPDGARLRTLVFPAAQPRANLLLLGGRADFLEKSAETIADLHSAGFTVAAFDWRGQGLSTRLLETGAGHIDSFDIFLADLDHLSDTLADDIAGPWVAIAHSMGAHLLLRWLADPARRGHPFRARLHAAALTAPFCGLAMPAPLSAAVLLAAGGQVRNRRGARFAWGQEPFGPRQTSLARQMILTHCPRRFAEERLWVEANPALACGGVTWGWIDAFARSEIALEALPLEALELPLLALLAAEERLVSNRAALRVLARIPSATVDIIEGAAHEILRERDEIRARALSRIRAFLGRNLP
ncbi:MAG: alpha/beta hydrolase [Thermaurantiacus sp.]